MKLKKLLTYALAGLMAVAVPVMAGVGSNSATVIAAEETSKEDTSKEDTSKDKPSSSTSTTTAPKRDPKPVKTEAQILEEKLAEEKARLEKEEAEATAKAIADYKAEQAAVAVVMAKASESAALAAQASGIPMSVSVQATGENKSVEEYMNNAVTDVPGIADATPVGQGGQVIINGEATNQTFSVQKPLVTQVQSAQAQAATLGGNVLNVADIKGSVSFETATVNFYMPGVTAGQNIQVYQLTDGTWNSVAVSEIREDHVVVDMTEYGVLAFIEVSAQ